MISMFQFMALYGGYYYKYYCFYIFTIHFLFSSTQFYSLLFVLFINYCYFLFMCLFVVAVSTFVFFCGHYWCLCACLRFELISLFFYFMVVVNVFVLIY